MASRFGTTARRNPRCSRRGEASNENEYRRLV
jgi:hypothetical protein